MKSSKHSNFSQNRTTVMNILYTMYICLCVIFSIFC